MKCIPGEAAFRVRKGREWRSRPLGGNKDIVRGSGARKLMGSHGRPEAKCVCMHGVVGPLGAPGVDGPSRGGGIGT